MTFVEVPIQFGSDAILLLEGLRSMVVFGELEALLMNLEVGTLAEDVVIFSQNLMQRIVINAR